MQIDTDSLYFGLSCDSVEEAVSRRCWKGSEHAEKNGSRGTNGVSENRGCTSWSSRALAELLCAASVISWRTRMEKAKFCSEAPKQT